MAHIKNLSNRAYISGSLKDKLSRFEMYRYSFIYAPTGYGKSKVIRTFFKNYPGYTVLWIDAESPERFFGIISAMLSKCLIILGCSF